MIRFGHYYLPLPTPERGEIVVLDGMNGFTDQSLKGFYSGDELLFLINTGGDWAYPRWEALEVVR
ncbi:MAG: hypothetical protein KDC54_23515, partial [Lewinella sp.]|nr:hypothetical protein [Lewinella sp.]